jgi:hypothetical protein
MFFSCLREDDGDYSMLEEQILPQRRRGRGEKFLFHWLLKKAADVIARSEATKQSSSFSDGEIASLPPVARNDACLFLFLHPYS